jgi:EAL domain-containing protein (putative c-di-GMP-specific phosphodiesterase class I)
MHSEIYTRLSIEGKVIRAAQFMPVIEHLALGSEFDKSLLESIAINQTILSSQQNIAINITQDSVGDESFHIWLNDFLGRQTETCRFHFELREDTILSLPAQSLHFVNIIKHQGAKVGIDNCGREMGSLAYLQTIKPDYVKLDQSLSCNPKSKMEMGELQEQLTLTQAVVNTAAGLDIEVIITGVEDNEQLDIVSLLHATGFQGFITAPSEID